MLLTDSINTGKFVMCLTDQELNLIGIAIRGLRDNESEEPTPFDVLLQVDSATFAEQLRHWEEILGVDHGCGDCDRGDCNGGEESVPDWINEDGEEPIPS